MKMKMCSSVVGGGGEDECELIRQFNTVYKIYVRSTSI